ncbi:MAG TPA: TrkA family potassium uptake protein [Anaerolineae bacterium]|jgi:trk system potassium uptake protein TrkA|nr:TrkA family potassium uptake protein [Anaerolineae bacterium]
MRIVILGCGRVGSQLARLLLIDGHQVTVVDKDSASFGRLGSDFAGEVVLGTGIDEDVLLRAGIEEADAVVAVTSGDNTNVMAAQVAKEIFGVPKVICRVDDPLREEIYRSLGLETICATVWQANHIRESLEGRESGGEPCM